MDNRSFWYFEEQQRLWFTWINAHQTDILHWSRTQNLFGKCKVWTILDFLALFHVQSVANRKYHRQQNKCYPSKVSDCHKNCSWWQHVHSVMKCNSSNKIKFDLCYYGQANSLLLKSSVASKWAFRQLWGYYLFCWWL